MSADIATIDEIYKIVCPLPNDSILFGMATDNMPVLMSTHADKGANVIVWDRVVGQGLNLVKCAIEFILRYKTGDRTEFVVFSNKTKEWAQLSNCELGVWNKNECIAIIPYWDIVADQILFSLAEWVHRTRALKPVVLFFDDFDNITRMGADSQQWLRYIMEYGKKKNIYVVGTTKSENRDSILKWMDCFQAQIFGENKSYWFEMDKKRKSVRFFTPRTTI